MRLIPDFKKVSMDRLIYSPKRWINTWLYQFAFKCALVLYHVTLVLSSFSFDELVFLFLILNFNVLCSVWVARRPPGYAFIDFDDRRDAQDAIRELDGRIIEIYIVNIYLLWSSDHPILRPGIHLSGYEKVPFYLVGLFSWELMMSTWFYFCISNLNTLSCFTFFPVHSGTGVEHRPSSY